MIFKLIVRKRFARRSLSLRTAFRDANCDRIPVDQHERKLIKLVNSQRSDQSGFAPESCAQLVSWNGGFFYRPSRLRPLPSFPVARFARRHLFALPRLGGLFTGHTNGDALTFAKVQSRAARFVLHIYDRSTRSCDLVCKPVRDSLEADNRFLAQTPMFYLITEKLLEITPLTRKYTFSNVEISFITVKIHSF